MDEKNLKFFYIDRHLIFYEIWLVLEHLFILTRFQFHVFTSTNLHFNAWDKINWDHHQMQPEIPGDKNLYIIYSLSIYLKRNDCVIFLCIFFAFNRSDFLKKSLINKRKIYGVLITVNLMFRKKAKKNKTNFGKNIILILNLHSIFAFLQTESCGSANLYRHPKKSQFFLAVFLPIFEISNCLAAID